MNNDHLFRVSLKAVIKNDKGHVLVVKEKGTKLWNFPGGGMDYGETYKEALRRELHEEIGYQGELSMNIVIATEAGKLVGRSEETWQVCLIHEVQTENNDFKVGVDIEDIRFASLQTLEDEIESCSRLIDTYCSWVRRNNNA